MFSPSKSTTLEITSHICSPYYCAPLFSASSIQSYHSVPVFLLIPSNMTYSHISNPTPFWDELPLAQSEDSYSSSSFSIPSIPTPSLSKLTLHFSASRSEQLDSTQFFRTKKQLNPEVSSRSAFFEVFWHFWPILHAIKSSQTDQSLFYLFSLIQTNNKQKLSHHLLILLRGLSLSKFLSLILSLSWPWRLLFFLFPSLLISLISEL